MIEFRTWLEGLPGWVAFVGAPLLFACFWPLCLKLVASKSGWTRLAKGYGFSGQFKGELYRFQSGRMNTMGFGNSLNVGIDRSGLYLVPIFVFRLFFKPLLIPWDGISASPVKRWTFNGCRLSFPAVPEVTLDFYGKTFELVREALAEKMDAALDA